MLPGDNSADNYEEKAKRNGGLSRVCAAALELQLRGQVADVQKLSTELQTLINADVLRNWTWGIPSQ